MTSKSTRARSLLAIGAALAACKGRNVDRAPLPSAVVPGATEVMKPPPPEQRPSSASTGRAPGAAVPASPVVPSSAPADDFAGVAGITDVSRQGSPVQLVGVRWARHATFDRVVFEYDGAVPGYHVEYVDRPVRQCGSGEATPVAGDAWLLVKTTPADAHTEAGHPTVPWREQKAELGVLREIERICDFEAEVTHVLGVASPNRYRVIELSAPPRLVVDVRHGR